MRSSFICRLNALNNVSISCVCAHHHLDEFSGRNNYWPARNFNNESEIRVYLASFNRMRIEGLSSMKSGVVAGAIGGLVGSIVAVLIVVLESLFVGLEPTPVPVEQIIVTFFVITIIFGAIFGAIYQKLHDPIPGRGILKGV